MGWRRVVTALGAMVVGTTASSGAWTMLDEVQIIDLNLSAEVVWEIPNATAYCNSKPPTLDRLACPLRSPDEFWIGTDAAGNSYGVLVADEPLGSYFDLHRRPAGTRFDHHVVRITKRVEQVFGQPVKLYAAGPWEVDLTHGWLLIHFRGQCLTAACQASGDTSEYLGLLRITGLPSLIEIANSFTPAGALTFGVPVHPEGLPTGERFDVYVGDVGTVADLSLAQPFACDAAPAAVPGRRVVIPDPLAPPAPGQARYYLTAVTGGGLVRAGSMRVGGVTYGRDASRLPPCVPSS